MKSQYLIFKGGELVGKVTARDPQRACLLFAVRQGGNPRDYIAVATVSTDAVHEAARQRSWEISA